VAARVRPVSGEGQSAMRSRLAQKCIIAPRSCESRSRAATSPPAVCPGICAARATGGAWACPSSRWYLLSANANRQPRYLAVEREEELKATSY
jgi:hypothetical protein